MDRDREFGDRLAVIIPTYGRDDLTAAVLDDLRPHDGPLAIYLVDNRGDYPEPYCGEVLLRPGSNLGWAGGCNWGLLAAQGKFDAYVLLNNDVRLSPHFLLNMVEGWRTRGASLLGPVYDHNWPHQRSSYEGDAASYEARTRDHRVPFVDGTCMFIPEATLNRVGLLDAESWPRHGWGCDKDYALRVRQIGGSVWVTERCYLNHLGRQTAVTFGGYSERAAEDENDSGMAAKWGSQWVDRLFEGFEGLTRVGRTQSALRESLRHSPD